MPQTNGKTYQGQLFLMANLCKQIRFVFPTYDTILLKCLSVTARLSYRSCLNPTPNHDIHRITAYA